MLGVRLNLGIDAWTNNRVAVMYLIDRLLTTCFLEALFSQMGILEINTLSDGDRNTCMRNAWA